MRRLLWKRHWKTVVHNELWGLLRLSVVGEVVGDLGGRRHVVLVRCVSEGTLLFPW